MSEEKRVLERIKKVDPKMSGRKQKNKTKKNGGLKSVEVDVVTKFIKDNTSFYTR